jgi:hypothetical protein
MLQENNKLQEGIESVNRIKLLMGYDMGKTLNENLNEQSMFAGGQGGYAAQDLSGKSKKIKLTPEQLKYQKEHPEMVWDPEAFDETKPSLNQQGKTVYPKGKFVPLTPENMGLRGVPFGFSPIEYPEYLKKVEEINKKYPKSKTTLNPTTWVNSDIDDKREKLLADLKNQYYHKDFPEGITQSQFARQMAVKKEISAQQKKELDSIEKAYKGKTPYNGKITLYPDKTQIDMYNKEREILSKKSKEKSEINTKYKTMEQYIDAVTGYDPVSNIEIEKTELEKFWDKYYWIAELVGWVALDFFTEGYAVEVGAGRQLSLLSKLFGGKLTPKVMANIIRLGVPAGVSVAVGSYITIKNEKLTSDAMFYFVFALLPFAHSFFKIPGEPSVDLCDSIIRKMAEYNLHNPKELRIFMSTLNTEQKTLFREVALLDKTTLKEGIQKSLEVIASKNKSKIIKAIYNASDRVVPSSFFTIGKFAARLAVDFSGIEAVKKLVERTGLMDKYLKEKEFIEKFHQELNARKDPQYQLILTINTLNTLFEHPEWDPKLIMDSSTKESNSDIEENNPNKIMKKITTGLTKYDIESLLVDKNHNPVKLN